MLTYKTMIIDSPDMICSCPVFKINNAQWTCKRKPSAQGRMAYIPGQGLFISMSCDETDPLRTVSENMGRVCGDSALEAFFAFPDADAPLDGEGCPSNDGLYFNFEINANGALYAKTGRGRKNRFPLTAEEMIEASPSAWVSHDGWGAEFLVPSDLLLRSAGIEELDIGSVFFCNFYKISENPNIEHYFSFSPVQSDTPNFHLPRYFAKSIVGGRLL
ncbi:MAG: carbohydrate-binding family 9-like protein [Oscillospiraceae bacterium]|nr:carbohydrate-binding family 9-like protein [Oscillospiraceae bacterium]